MKLTKNDLAILRWIARVGVVSVFPEVVGRFGSPQSISGRHDPERPKLTARRLVQLREAGYVSLNTHYGLRLRRKQDPWSYEITDAGRKAIAS